MLYRGPKVELTVAEHAIIHRQQRSRAAVALARRSARQYAKIVLRSLSNGYNAKFEDIAGGLPGIARTMATYQVYGPLQEFAARVCVRLVKEGLAK